MTVFETSLKLSDGLKRQPYEWLTHRSSRQDINCSSVYLKFRGHEHGQRRVYTRSAVSACIRRHDCVEIEYLRIGLILVPHRF